MDGPTAADVDHVLAETEQWFIHQGLPHFIEDYTAREEVLPRTVPVLLLAFAFSIIRTASPGWALWQHLVVTVVSLLAFTAVWAAFNRLRDNPALQPPKTVGVVEVAVFVTGPAILGFIVGSTRPALVSIGLKIFQLGVIYYSTSYGLVPMTYWNGRRVLDHLYLPARLAIRTAPLLLLAMTFLLFNSPAWKTIAVTPLLRYIGLLTLFAAVTILFAYHLVESRLDAAMTFDSWEDVRTYCIDSPMETVVMTTDSELPLPELSRRERLNILLMDIYSVGAYVIVTTLFMVAFFILFGLLAIPADVVAELVGRPVDPLLTIPLGAYPIVLTRELLRVSGFVAVFSGLYLIVHAATDRTFQSEVDDSVKEQTRRAVAVRAVYLRYLHNDG